jgi:hypothetical protein
MKILGGDVTSRYRLHNSPLLPSVLSCLLCITLASHDALQYQEKKFQTRAQSNNRYVTRATKTSKLSVGVAPDPISNVHCHSCL